MRKMENYLSFINNRIQKHLEPMPSNFETQDDRQIPSINKDKVKRHLNQIKMRVEKSLKLKTNKMLSHDTCCSSSMIKDDYFT